MTEEEKRAIMMQLLGQPNQLAPSSQPMTPEQMQKSMGQQYTQPSQLTPEQMQQMMGQQYMQQVPNRQPTPAEMQKMMSDNVYRSNGQPPITQQQIPQMMSPNTSQYNRGDIYSMLPPGLKTPW